MFIISLRSDTSPIVSFQFQAVSIVCPSTAQPPGKRKNLGCIASSCSIKSLRKPCPLYVSSGISDTISTSRSLSPVFVTIIPLPSLSSSSSAVNVTEYFFQSSFELHFITAAASLKGSTSKLALCSSITIPNDTVSLPSPRAYTEKSYFSPFLNFIPLKDVPLSQSHSVPS